MRRRGAASAAWVLLAMLGATHPAGAADSVHVAADWQQGTFAAGLQGVGIPGINEVTFPVDIGPCHRTVQVDLGFEPREARAGVPSVGEASMAFVFDVALLNASGAVLGERTINSPGHGRALAMVPEAGTYDVRLRLDVGAAVDWSLRIRGLHAFGEPVCDVFLNEVDINPDGPDMGAEWIELYNRGFSAVDLSGWHVRGVSWSTFVDPTPFVLPPGTVVPAGGYLQVVLSTGEFFDDVDEVVHLEDPDGYLLGATPLLEDKGQAHPRSWARVDDGSPLWAFGPSTPEASNGT